MNNIVVDQTLTPENCHEHGFEWWQDHIYDPDAPKEANEDYVKLIKEGWKIGQPANLNTLVNDGVGIYKPIAKKQNRSFQFK